MQIIRTDNFADIYNLSCNDDSIDWLEYYRLRDNFIEYNESLLQDGEIGFEEFYTLFEAPPVISYRPFRALAEVTAQEYLARNGIDIAPDWTFETYLDEDNPFFVKACFDASLMKEIIEQTPAPYRERNIFVGSNHLEYR